MGMTGIFAMSMIGSRLQDYLFPYVCVSGCLQISVRLCLFCFYSCLPTHFYLSLPHSLYSPLTPLLSLPLSVPPPHSLSHSPFLLYSLSLSFSLSYSPPSPFQPPTSSSTPATVDPLSLTTPCLSLHIAYQAPISRPSALLAASPFQLEFESEVKGRGEG